MTKIASPRIPFPPPSIFVFGFGIGWYIARYFPFRLLSQKYRETEMIFGWILILIGFGIMFTALIAFILARTAIMPNLPAKRLLTSGPYRLSRNPMYVGLTIAYVGGILLTNIGWCLLILIVVLIVFEKVIIPHEERYLQSAFGEVYSEYANRVRRWF